jgi:hypothetical protein
LGNLGFQHGDLRLGDILLVQRHFVVFLRVIESRSRDNAVLRHADGAVVGSLEQRHVWTFRINFSPLEVCFRAVEAGIRGF